VNTSKRFERTPLESREPIVAFAVIRALLPVTALVVLAALGFPYEGHATITVAVVALPWSLAMLALTRRSPTAALHPLVAVGDFAVLGVLQVAEPELYAPVHFVALFLVAAHAHFQGARRSVPIGLLPPLILIPVTALTDVPVDDGLLKAYEGVFTATCLSIALVVGALRTAESSGRLRARAVSRRAIDTESQVRRRLAESIHDGPIQELSSVELMLASAEQDLAHGDAQTARSTLQEARQLTRGNVRFLRDEVLELGPHAFEELTFEQAIADCVEVWRRRHAFDVHLEIAPEDLPPEVAGSLFRITQEAVANCGKHAEASNVTVRLRGEPDQFVLEVEDDGRGFGDIDPLGPGEPGHIGLASMRERAEMLGGQLTVEGRDRGTCVRACIPR